jgi:hypothetical protein
MHGGRVGSDEIHIIRFQPIGSLVTLVTFRFSLSPHPFPASNRHAQQATCLLSLQIQSAYEVRRNQTHWLWLNFVVSLWAVLLEVIQ